MKEYIKDEPKANRYEIPSVIREVDGISGVDDMDANEKEAIDMAIEALQEPNMIPIKLEKRYPESRDEDITDAFMQGYLKGAEISTIKVQGYTEWLEKNIVEAGTFEWLCEDTTDEEWCEKNCKYTSIQAECLRHLYEVSKGGDEE